MNKKELISIIQKTKTFNTPKLALEQYSIDAVSAVDIIFYAGFEHNDIKNRVILDLGSGTGRLSIAALFLQAFLVINIDIDPLALKILQNNCMELNIYHLTHPICADINNLPFFRKNIYEGFRITTIMNPPFGVQKKKADRLFLDMAFDNSDVIYSVHLSNKDNREFLISYIEKRNWFVDDIFSFNMILERSFQFHSKKRKNILVDLYRLIKR